MGIHKQPDWANITFEELIGLNGNQLKRYQKWLDAQETKTKIKKDFQNYLEESCSAYTNDSGENKTT